MRHYLIYLSISVAIFCLIACDRKLKSPAGGYKYLANISAGDSNYYYLPIKNLIPRKDSFMYVYACSFFQALKEPNLSLKPQGEDIFRLIITEAFGGFIIVTLTNSQITIKRGHENSAPTEDKKRLTPEENMYYDLLKRYYPVDEGVHSEFNQHYIDSLCKIKPQLKDPKYYEYLINKILIPGPFKLPFVTKKIYIPEQTFVHLVNIINSSGYWILPYWFPCAPIPHDGWGFSLEANTKDRYNYVCRNGCENDTCRFLKACMEIMKCAGIDENNIFEDRNN